MTTDYDERDNVVQFTRPIGHRKRISEKRAERAHLVPKVGEEWSRMPGETNKAYEAFVVYRDLGRDNRSLQKTADALGKARTMITQWSSVWQWQLRVREWDAMQSRALARERERARVEKADATLQQQETSKSDQLRAARALKQEALRVLAFEQDKAAKQAKRQPGGGDPDAKAVALAAQALEKAQNMERIALGLPTDISKTDVTLRDTAKEALDMQRMLRDLIIEDLCDDCRKKLRDKLVRLADRDRDLTARLA